MRLTIVNLMNSVSMAEFRTVIAALQRQVDEDFTPEWYARGRLRAVGASAFRGQAQLDGAPDAMIYVGDSSTDPTTGVDNALGYHSTNYRAVPYGFVYLDVVRQVQEEWTITLSHEVLELLADPTTAMAVYGPDPRSTRRRVQYALEVCDPTQGDSYEIDGVHVSNFVTRAWFGLQGPSRATNFLDHPLDPFKVRPAGYFVYRDGRGSHQIQGERYDVAARRRDREMMKLGRRNTRRDEASAEDHAQDP